MMNQEDLFKKIGSILQELQDQYDFLAQNPQQLNELELELFQANASFLSDHVEIIKKVNNAKSVKELPAAEPDIVPANPVLEELFKPDNESPTFEFVLNDQSLSDKFDFEEKPVYEIFDRPLSAEEQEIISRKQQLLADQEPKMTVEVPAAPATEVKLTEYTMEAETPASIEQVQEEIQEVNDHRYVSPELEEIPDTSDPDDELSEENVLADHEADEADEKVLEEEEILTEEEEDEIGPEPFLVVEEKIADSIVPEPVSAPIVAAEIPTVFDTPAHKPTLNEMLAANASGSKNIGFERSRLPVTDLKGAINLNEKLLYIKDLFNGYNLAYAEVIDILNKMPDFKTADQFLQSNYAVKNNWASKEGTVAQFYELLHLRFPD
ncbi:hypothetical protein [Pedobacter duraquae]|uniref:Uncharacterized protein n=1 Tax=Pedobacter duraquae TaxID=425511 RepID=A0A4R6IIZ4_9SPHI|nr:hypothetical protein [Pedobacter duraquae]TDO21943.1 hypothetical protein CLV32_3052 [Pedobacter duraquae]